MAKRTKQTNNTKTIILGLLGIILIGIIAYSVLFTLNTGAETKGVITCATPDNCFWTAHFHVFVPIDVCGALYKLPVEVGSLQKAHTHEEENIVHWHDRLAYDNVNKKIVDTTELKLGSFFKEVNIPFSSTQFNTLRNGDACPNGGVGTLKVLVNGKVNTEFENYEMHDRDSIWIVFDDRTIQEIEAEWATNPKKFPTLGSG